VSPWRQRWTSCASVNSPGFASTARSYGHGARRSVQVICTAARLK
jgi:hypothetical protein